MTNETEYGPEIVVDGVRLPWLDLEDFVHHKFRGRWSGPSRVGYLNFAEITAIRLPASHPYYTVLNHNAKHGTQFKYWPGGDEAPGDYDASQDVFLRNGNLVRQPVRWTHYGIFNGGDIIGYTPKLCADRIGNADVTKQPDFVPCERTVRLCIEKLPEVSAHSAADMQAEGIGIDRCREALEALLPKKDRAEELVEAWRGVDLVSPQTREALLGYTRDMLAQGEIRG